MPTLGLRALQPSYTVDPIPVARNEFERGVVAGGSGLSAGKYAEEALRAEAKGDLDRARYLYTEAERVAAEGAERGPSIRSVYDVKNMSDLGDFLAGTAGQAITSTLPSITGATLGRGLGGSIGGALGAYVPAVVQEAGETALNMRLNPAADPLDAVSRRNLAYEKGLKAGVLEAAVPYLVGERLAMGGVRGLRSGGREIAKAGGQEAVTETLQQRLGQRAMDVADPYRDTSTDVQELADAAIAGLTGGASIGTAPLVQGTVQQGLEKAAQYLDRRMRPSGPSAAAGSPDEPPPGPVPLSDFARTLRTDVATPEIEAGQFMQGRDTPPEGIPIDQLPAWVTQQDERRKFDTEGYALRILNDDTSSEADREQAKRWMYNLDDPTTWAEAGAHREASGQSAKRAGALNRFGEKISRMRSESKTKESGERTPFDDKLDAIVKSAAPDASQEFVEDLKWYVRNYWRTTRPVPQEVFDVLGPQTERVITELSNEMPRAPGERAPDIVRRASRERTRAIQRTPLDVRFLRRNLNEGQEASDADLQLLAENLREYVQQGTSELGKFRIEPQLKQYFGDVNHVLNYFGRQSKEDQRAEAAENILEQSRAGLEDTADESERSDFGSLLRELDLSEQAQVMHGKSARESVQHSNAMEEKTEDASYFLKRDGKPFDPLFQQNKDSHIAKVRELASSLYSKGEASFVTALDWARDTNKDVNKVAADLGYNPATAREAAETFLQRHLVVKISQPMEGIDLTSAELRSKGIRARKNAQKASEGVMHVQFRDGSVARVSMQAAIQRLASRVKAPDSGKRRYAQLAGDVLGTILANEDVREITFIDASGQRVTQMPPEMQIFNEGQGRIYTAEDLFSQRKAKGPERQGDLFYTAPKARKPSKARTQREQMRRTIESQRRAVVDSATEGTMKELVKAIRQFFGYAFADGGAAATFDRRGRLFDKAREIESALPEATHGEARERMQSQMGKLRRQGANLSVAGDLQQQAEAQMHEMLDVLENAHPNAYRELVDELNLVEDREARQPEKEITERSDTSRTVRRKHMEGVKESERTKVAAIEQAQEVVEEAPFARREPARLFDAETGERLGGFANGQQRYVWVQGKGWQADPDGQLLAEVGKKDGVVYVGVRDTKGGKAGRMKFSEMNIGDKQMSDKQKKEIRAYVEKVLGPKLKVVFANMRVAGNFNEHDGIRISVYALSPESVAFHEAMHALFAKADQKVKDVLTRAATSGRVMNKLRELLADHPAALRALSDPEEATAYMYQFWASGKLKLGTQTEGIFKRIAKAIARAVGIISNDDRAVEIMDAFHIGALREPSGATALADDQWNANVAGRSLLNTFKYMWYSADGLIRDMGIPALTELADMFYKPAERESGDSTYIKAREQQTGVFLRKFSKILEEENATEESLQQALHELQTEKPSVGRLAGRIRHFLRSEMLPYLRDAGLEVKDAGPYYFPRIWSSEEIAKKRMDLVRIFEKYPNELAKIFPDKTPNQASVLFADRIAAEPGAHSEPWEDERDVGYTPLMRAMKQRAFRFISGEDAEPFLEKDLVNIITTYIGQGVKRAEYTRRFGAKGERLAELLDRAIGEGATPEQIQHAGRYVMAMEGTIGHDIDPSLRSTMGWIMVYQNLRLLPLSLMSQFVDAIGIMVRGGTFADSLNAMKLSFKEIWRTYNPSAAKDEQVLLAETLGIVDERMLMESLGMMYSSVYLHGWGRRINDAFFRYNAMEGWNRGMRAGAGAAASRFIWKHTFMPNEHSERYLAELGLTADEVRAEADLFNPQNPKIREAIFRWVDGAVLRPSAPERPIWASDPHYMLVFHLKQFTYSFWKVIVARAIHEGAHGNFSPTWLLTSYVPAMIAIDTLKGLMLNGGDEPDWKKGWGASDYAWYGIQRSGLLGAGQFAVDMQIGGISALGGPSVEQLVKNVSSPFTERNLIETLPLQPLYKNLVID